MTSCKSRDFDHVQIIAVMVVARIVFHFFFFFLTFLPSPLLSKGYHYWVVLFMEINDIVSF